MADRFGSWRFERAPEPARLEPIWRDLEERSDGSFFLSWSWIGTWLALHAGQPWLATAQGPDGRIWGMALFCRTSSPLGASLCLHQTGDRDRDRIWIEYNGVLLDRRAPPGTLVALFVALAGREARAAGLRWRTLQLAGAEERVAEAAAAAGLSLEIDRKRSARVALRALRTSHADFVSSLGPNTRHHVRRSLRHYEREGPLSLEVASDLGTALRWLGELRRLNDHRFGAKGAFAAPGFLDFHQRLVAWAHPEGVVELLRISAGDHPIGYLYDFRRRHWIGNYASGFDYDTPKQVKPGLLCFSLAAERALSEGADCYDYMAGDHDYKWHLGTDGPDLLWLRARRPGLRTRIEDTARALLRKWR